MGILDNFTNIGKAVLIQALGIQQNYTTIIDSSVEVTDYSNDNCSTCKYKAIIESFSSDNDIYKMAIDNCNNCPHRILTTKNVTKKIYHNEKNRYGYRPMLKSNALKLFMLLHFYHPDRFGIIKEINIKELASILKCNIKTIWNNLDILSSYTYISYSKTSSSIISLLINDYENYYLPANKNGRGFFMLSKELITKLFDINSIVTLRIYLRELINLDSSNLKGQASVDHKSISEIRHMLPKYCKPCIIKQHMSNSDADIFNVTINDNIIRFEISSRYIAKKQKQILLEENIDRLKSFINDFNTVIPNINSGDIPPVRFREFINIDTNISNYKLIKISKLDLEDLANIAVHYSFDLLMYALADIYRQYIVYERSIKNIPGLVSTIIRANVSKLKKAA